MYQNFLSTPISFLHAEYLILHYFSITQMSTSKNKFNIIIIEYIRIETMSNDEKMNK